MPTKKKIVHLKKIPENMGFSGKLLQMSKPAKFTPDTLFDSIGLAKKDRPVWLLLQMSRTQKALYDADSMRAVNLAIKDFELKKIPEINTKEYPKFTERVSEHVDTNLMFKIVKECIVGCENDDAFKLNSSGTHIDDDLFEAYPEELLSAFFIKVMEMSNLSLQDKLGLK